MLLPSCCIPTKSPRVLLFVSESVQAALAEGTPRVQCQKRTCDNTTPLCKTSPRFSCIFAARHFPQSLVQSTATLFRVSGGICNTNTEKKLQGRRTKEPIWRPASCRHLRTCTSFLPLPILQTLKLHQGRCAGFGPHHPSAAWCCPAATTRGEGSPGQPGYPQHYPEIAQIVCAALLHHPEQTLPVSGGAVPPQLLPPPRR